MNFRFAEANSSSVSPPKKSYGNKGNFSALKTHKHLTAQKSKAKFGISAFNDKKLITQKPSFVVAYGLDQPGVDQNLVSALTIQTGKIPQRGQLEKVASAALAEEALASFQNNEIMARATPSITEETPKKKYEKLPDDKND